MGIFEEGIQQQGWNDEDAHSGFHIPVTFHTWIEQQLCCTSFWTPRKLSGNVMCDMITKISNYESCAFPERWTIRSSPHPESHSKWNQLQWLIRLINFQQLLNFTQ